MCLIAERFLKLEKEIDELKVSGDGLSVPGRFAVRLYVLCHVYRLEIIVCSRTFQSFQAVYLMTTYIGWPKVSHHNVGCAGS